MRRVLLIGVAALALVSLGGCVSPEQHAANIETGALRAGDEAYTRAKDEALKRGLSEVVAEEMAKEAKKIAYIAAKKAGEAIPRTGALGQILATVLYGLVQFGLPMLGKKVGTA